MVDQMAYLAGQNRGPGLVICSICTAAIATTFVVLRLISRAMTRPGSVFAPRFWWDDWMIIASVVTMWIMPLYTIQLVRLGLGRHIWTIPPENLGDIFQGFWIIYFFYDLSLALAKASVLLFYSRIFFTQIKTWFQYAIYAIHAMNIAWLLGLYLAYLLMCHPIEKNWDLTVPGYCTSISNIWLGSAVPSVVVDLLILVIPLPKIWNLSLGRGKKVGLTAVFLLGYSVIIISVGRVISCFVLSPKMDHDITYEGIPTSYWDVAEIPVTIISACLPTMVTLGRRIASQIPHTNTYISSFFKSTRSSSPNTFDLDKRSKASIIGTPVSHNQSHLEYQSHQKNKKSTYTVHVSGDSRSYNALAMSSMLEKGSDEQGSYLESDMPQSNIIHMQSEVSVVSVCSDSIHSRNEIV